MAAACEAAAAPEEAALAAEAQVEAGQAAEAPAEAAMAEVEVEAGATATGFLALVREAAAVGEAKVLVPSAG